MDAIQIDDLYFSYGDLEIFRGLSLTIPAGQVVAILGASGSGKSTLLRLIGGQLRPSGGTVKVLLHSGQRICCPAACSETWSIF